MNKNYYCVTVVENNRPTMYQCLFENGEWYVRKYQSLNLNNGYSKLSNYIKDFQEIIKELLIKKGVII